MTTVDRNQFIRDLGQQGIDVRSDHPSVAAQSLRDAGVSQADLDRIAGPDHVIRGEAEYGQLYDRLQQIQAEAARRGPQGNFDRAQRVYDQLKGTAPEAPPVDLSFGSRRPRTTGIFAQSPLLPHVQLNDSDDVRTLGQREASALDGAAQRNNTGPEAGAQRRIRAITESTVEQLQTLERQRDALPANSPDRAKINAQIRTTVTAFENSIASEKAGLQAARTAERPLLDPSRLGPIGSVVERQGLPIPGTNGAVRPNPSGGAEVIFRFK
jgi:hypothetical protein